MTKRIFRKNTSVLSLGCLISFCVMDINIGYAQKSGLPAWVKDDFFKKELDKRYSFGKYLTPSFLIADFDGDKSLDVAVLIVEKGTGKRGVLIVHKKNEYYILGAGSVFGNGGDDFKWANKWNLFSKKNTSETVVNSETGDILGGKSKTLLHPAIEIDDTLQGSGGLIYWDGKKYTWIHQGE